MKRLATIAAGLLLDTPMAANAEQTFLTCTVKSGVGVGNWNITLNESASTVSMTNLKNPQTVLAGFAPRRVTWTLVEGEIQMAYRLNRITGEISNRMIVPSSWSQEGVEKRSGLGICKVIPGTAERIF